MKGAGIALDVGGSAVKGGLVRPGGRLWGTVARHEIDSSGPAHELIARIASAISQLRGKAANEPLAGVAVAFPGPFDYANGVSRIRGLGKFDSLYGLELQALLQERVPELAALPWLWINDAEAFALGELRFGAGQGAKRAVFLTLGTGCGSAFAVGGRLVGEGAGVPDQGHVYPLPCRDGTVDEWLSHQGLLKLWSETAGSTRSRGQYQGAEVAALARNGDEAAISAFARFGELLASALAGVFGEFGAERIVVGGGVSRAFALFAPRAREELARLLSPAPRLVRARHLGSAALLGAASSLPPPRIGWVP